MGNESAGRLGNIQALPEGMPKSSQGLPLRSKIRTAALSCPDSLRTGAGRGVTAREKGPRSRSAEAFDHTVRAGDRTRTGDVQLGKLAFYH